MIEARAEPGTPDIHGAYPIHYAAQMCGTSNDLGTDERTGLSGAEHPVPVSFAEMFFFLAQFCGG